MMPLFVPLAEMLGVAPGKLKLRLVVGNNRIARHCAVGHRVKLSIAAAGRVINPAVEISRRVESRADLRNIGLHHKIIGLA